MQFMPNISWAYLRCIALPQAAETIHAYSLSV